MTTQKIYIPFEIHGKEIQDTEPIIEELISQGWKLEGSAFVMNTTTPSFPIKIKILTRLI